MKTINKYKLSINLHNNLNRLFEITYGSDVDENDEFYKDVYKYETEGFISSVCNDVANLQAVTKIVGSNEFNYIVLSNWQFIDDNFNKEAFDIFCMDIYINSIKDSNNEINKRKIGINEFDLTKEDWSMLNSITHKNLNFIVRILTDYIIGKKDSFLLTLKQTDEEKYKSVLDMNIKEYIHLTNVLFKTQRYIPKREDWTIHLRIESFFGIDKNEFLLYK